MYFAAMALASFLRNVKPIECNIDNSPDAHLQWPSKAEKIVKSKHDDLSSPSFMLLDDFRGTITAKIRHSQDEYRQMRSNFKKKVEFLNKLSEEHRYPHIDVCFFGQRAGMIVRMSRPSEALFSLELLSQKSSNEREEFYTGMGRFSTHVHKTGGYFPKTNLSHVFLIENDIASPFLNELSTSNAFAKDIPSLHDAYVKLKRVPPTVNFDVFYPKFFFKKFVDESEASLTSKYSSRPIEPLSPEFMAIINKMMENESTLSEVVSSLSGIQKRSSRRSPSKSPSSIYFSSKRSSSRNSSAKRSSRL